MRPICACRLLVPMGNAPRSAQKPISSTARGPAQIQPARATSATRAAATTKSRTMPASTESGRLPTWRKLWGGNGDGPRRTLGTAAAHPTGPARGRTISAGLRWVLGGVPNLSRRGDGGRLARARTTGPAPARQRLAITRPRTGRPGPAGAREAERSPIVRRIWPPPPPRAITRGMARMPQQPPSPENDPRGLSSENRPPTEAIPGGGGSLGRGSLYGNSPRLPRPSPVPAPARANREGLGGIPPGLGLGE